MKIGVGSKIYETAKIVSKQVIIGDNCLIGDFAFVAPRKLVMEEGSQIGIHAIIGGGGNVYLKKYSVVGFGAMILPATDSTSAKYMCEAAPPDKREIIRGSITLGEGVYVGAGAIICVSKKCPHVKIGDFSVVGALSYIDTSISSNTIIYPRKDYVIKRRWNEK